MVANIVLVEGFCIDLNENKLFNRAMDVTLFLSCVTIFSTVSILTKIKLLCGFTVGNSDTTCVDICRRKYHKRIGKRLLEGVAPLLRDE